MGGRPNTHLVLVPGDQPTAQAKARVNSAALDVW